MSQHFWDQPAVEVTRLPLRLERDPTRVICRPFIPGDAERIQGILRRILALSEVRVEQLVQRLINDFSSRHRNIRRVVLRSFQAIHQHLPATVKVSALRQELIGFYFTMEYAFEAAALFNPSMVPDIDQTALPAGHTRFLMSLRATGEGHISSIVFRRGTIDVAGQVQIDPASPYCQPLEVDERAEHDTEELADQLRNMGAYSAVAASILGRVGQRVSLVELNQAIAEQRQGTPQPEQIATAIDSLLWVARANYDLRLPPEALPSELVLFPHSEAESHGIEDARFVRFQDDNGSQRYYATFTAYNGFRILPQLLEFRPGKRVQVHTISGRCAQNKGMALFPRKLAGRYAMIGRLDNENLFLMYSDDIRRWETATRLQEPAFSWNLIQLGNCGSPLETSAGWLLVTHGVGPMRQYAIGATLLDRNDPSQVLGQTRAPLLVARNDERSGYVPNVVYSCGAMLHHEHLVLPYAMSDMHSGFAKIRISSLLAALQRDGPGQQTVQAIDNAPSQ